MKNQNINKYKYLSIILAILLIIVLYKYFNGVNTGVQDTEVLSTTEDKMELLKIADTTNEDATNISVVVDNPDLMEIEKILDRRISMEKYEKEYDISLVYDKDKEIYKAKECSICGIKGVLYWKVENEILDKAYVDFNDCNEKLSSNQSRAIVDYLNSKVGEPKEAGHQTGGWFYRIWESNDVRYYLGSGSYSDIGGSYKIEFRVSRFSNPTTDSNTNDEIITLMQKIPNDNKVEDIVKMMGEPTDKNNNSIIYRAYKEKFNGLEGDIEFFYDSETSNITSIWWKYETTDECLKTYEKCVDYLKEKFGDYYVSPKNPDRKIWNDFSLLYNHNKTKVILKREYKQNNINK